MFPIMKNSAHYSCALIQYLVHSLPLTRPASFHSMNVLVLVLDDDCPGPEPMQHSPPLKKAL